MNEESQWKKFLSLRKSKIFGMFLMAIAGLLLTFSNLFVQLAIDANKRRIPTLEIVFTRSVVQFLLTLPVLLWRRVKVLPEKDNVTAIIIMGICGFLSVTFIYLGIDKVPLGDATVIMFTSPVFTSLFAYMFLSESCSIVDFICGFLSFLGIIIAARPDFIFGEKLGHVSVMFHKEKISQEKKEAIYLMGVGYVLLGAIFLSLYYVLTRKIGQSHDYLVNIFYPSLLGTIFIPLMMLPYSSLMIPGCWKAKLYMFLIGITAYFGLVFLTQSLNLENAGPLILIRNLDIVYAFILQYCFTGITPSWCSIAGGLTVMLATGIIIAKRWSIWKSESEETDLKEEEMLLSNSEKGLESKS